MKVLLIESATATSKPLMAVFKREGILAVAIDDGKKGFREALKPGYDVIIVALILQSMSGLSIITCLRKKGVQTPILAISRSDLVSDKVNALSIGADDYLTKPFATEELLARLKALTRRKAIIENVVLSYGDIHLDTLTHELIHGKTRVGLSLREYELLKALLDAQGGLVRREFLDNKVWGYDGPNMYNGLEVYVSFLRRKLKVLNCKTSIKAVTGAGYRLDKTTNKTNRPVKKRVKKE